MKQVFADTGYWIAVLYPRDELHRHALLIPGSLGKIQIVTSEWVFTEVLDSFAERGALLREAAAFAVSQVAIRPDVRVVSFGETTFDQAFELYRSRLDKAWSLTDCSSFLIMRQLGIADALTHDRHFEQAGFKALMRKADSADSS
jgi:predicted nucleic acid-binding protein